MLLSAGMLMFFTLGSSMVGDVCDEDELRTGTRCEGTYYAVFWWFIKMGTAFASLVMGALLVYTGFDERQNLLVDALGGDIASVAAGGPAPASSILEHAAKLRSHLQDRLATDPAQAEHNRALLEHLAAVERLAVDAPQLQPVAGELAQHAAFLRRQSPATLFRLRLVEIGLPLALSLVSILLVLCYPLTERRCREIERLLKQHRGAPMAS